MFTGQLYFKTTEIISKSNPVSQKHQMECNTENGNLISLMQKIYIPFPGV